MTLAQLIIALTSVIALPLILCTRPGTPVNRIGCLIALIGQPAWLYATLAAGDQQAMFIVAIWMTGWYAFGLLRPAPSADDQMQYIDLQKPAA